jgi:hypothetical protein
VARVLLGRDPHAFRDFARDVEAAFH